MLGYLHDPAANSHPTDCSMWGASKQATNRPFAKRARMDVHLYVPEGLAIDAA